MRAFLALTSLIISSASFAAEPCAKVKSISGSNCQDIKVNLDLSACPEKQGDVPASVVCTSPKAATASYTSSENLYSLTLRTEEAWGNIKWVADNAVSRQKIEIASAAKKKAEAKEQKKEEVVEEKVPTVTLPAPQAAPAESSPTMTWGGGLDLYYLYSFNRLASTTIDPAAYPPAGLSPVRYYDNYHNQFGLNLAELTLKRSGGEVGFNIDLQFGEMADSNAATGPSDGSAPFIDSVSKHIGQANIVYTPSWAPGWSLTAGKMYTHVGLELIRAKDSPNYSRSYTFGFGMPVWHTGVAVGFPVYKDKVSGTFFLYNGWNNLFDNNGGKTFGLQFKFVPLSTITIIYNLITGPEVDAHIGDYRTVNEINIVGTINERLQLMLEALVGFEPSYTPVDGSSFTKKWAGAYLAAKWKPNRYFLAPRFEVFRDQNGARIGNGTETYYSMTFTNGFDLGSGLEARLELRADISEDDVFVKDSGSASQSHFSTSAALLYAF